MKSTHSVLVEVAAQGEIDSIVPLVQSFYEHFQYRFVEGEKRGQLKEFVDAPSLGRLFAIRCDGVIVGYALIAFSYGLEFGGRVAFVDELFVQPSARSMGIGRKALAQIEEFCAACGMRALRLEVESDNSDAAALYMRTGFADSHRRLLTKPLLCDRTPQ